MGSPYEVMGRVFDVWTKHDPPGYDRWCDFLDTWYTQTGNIRTVLDVGCGTGALMRRLRDRGYEVSGIDPSAEMLAHAEQSLGSDVVLQRVRLPSPRLIDLGIFDAVISTFDALNYLPSEAELRTSLAQIGRLIRPGGLLIFDLNTPYKFRHVFGSYHHGDDFGDLAYVWRNRPEPESRTTEFLITMFVRNGTRFERHEERHVERWHSDDEVESALQAARFELIGVYDDYTLDSAGPTTARATWVAGRV